MIKCLVRRCFFIVGYVLPDIIIDESKNNLKIEFAIVVQLTTLGYFGYLGRAIHNNLSNPSLTTVGIFYVGGYLGDVQNGDWCLRHLTLLHT